MSSIVKIFSGVVGSQVGFFAVHGLLLLLVTLDYSEKQGLVELLWIGWMILGIEVIGWAVSYWLSDGSRKRWKAFWSFWLIAVGIVQVIRGAYMHVEGVQLSWDVWWYGVRNMGSFWRLLWVAAPTWIWWALLGMYVVAWGIIAWSRRPGGRRDGKKGAVGILVGVIMIMGGVTWQQTTGGSVLTEAAAEGLGVAVSPDHLPKVFTADRSQSRHLKVTADTKKMNVVVVNLESTRADALTPYNSALPTTPFLKKIADEGMVVERAYTSQPHTSKSLVSILCGAPSNVTNDISEASEGGLPYDCLPKMLGSVGYRSAFFQPAKRQFENREELIENMGFGHFISLEDLDQERFKKTNYFGIEERALMEPVMEWVDTSDEPFFLSILTLSSHHYYKTPEGFERQDFADDPIWNDYLNTVYYVDTFLAELFAAFKERGLLESTLFVFVADHGEGLKTHNNLGHHNLFEEVVRVPLIVWNEDLVESGNISGLRQQIDIMPTIFDLLDFSVEGQFLGESLLEPSSRKALFAKCFLQNCTGVITKDKKIIFNQAKDTAAVFDLVNDPGEIHDLGDVTPEGELQYARKQVAAWKQKVTNWYGRE